MKNAGVEEGVEVTGKDLLEVNFKDRRRQLSDEYIFLGCRVEKLLSEVGLTRSSKEIQPFLSSVRDFYEEAIYKIKKYFSVLIKS